LVAESNNCGLCVYQDSKDNKGIVLTDGGRHISSWFDIVPVKDGVWEGKAYVILTHCFGKCLDIFESKMINDSDVVQFDQFKSYATGGNNQLWLIVSADKPLVQPAITKPIQNQNQNQNQNNGFFPNINIPNINIPHINIPNIPHINIPNIPIPNINIPGFGGNKNPTV